MTYAPEIGDGGVVRGCFSMIVDATEQYETEQALKAERGEISGIISQSSEGIWRIELDEPISTSLPVDQQVRSAYEHGYLAECNDAMARQYGFDRLTKLSARGSATCLLRVTQITRNF